VVVLQKAPITERQGHDVEFHKFIVCIGNAADPDDHRGRIARPLSATGRAFGNVLGLFSQPLIAEKQLTVAELLRGSEGQVHLIDAKGRRTPTSTSSRKTLIPSHE